MTYGLGSRRVKQNVHGAAAAARDRRKNFYCFSHVLGLFIGKKHVLSKKIFSKFLG
jgi:hypothetical protein